MNAAPLMKPMATPIGLLAPVLDVARAHAPAVDAAGRFPVETIDALRQGGYLRALVPVELGGGGQSLGAVAGVCYALGKVCASSAMILAMHHIQVACLSRHALGSSWQRKFLARVADEAMLLASVTSEVGIGGNMRASSCALQPVQESAGSRFSLHKKAPTISYGAYADAFLITARADPEAERGDQVLVVVPRDDIAMERTGGWNAMGMRGTSSEAFVIGAEVGLDQVVPAPFSSIASETMVPVSHLLWASLWSGIAADAVTRTRACLRTALRRGAEPAPSSVARLAGAVERLQMVDAWVNQTLRRHETGSAGSPSCSAAEMNLLKTGVSEACLGIVEDLMKICGFAGYGNDGPYSLSRHLRDLHSGELMVSNDRMRETTGRLLLMQAPELGIG